MTLHITKRIAGGVLGLFVGTLLALAAPLTYAQTTTDTTITSTPTAPSTGQGGDAPATLTMLGVSALALVAGGAYLARTRKEL